MAGQESIDYSQVARKEHLKPVEINLRIMEDVVRETAPQTKAPRAFPAMQ